MQLGLDVLLLSFQRLNFLLLLCMLLLIVGNLRLLSLQGTLELLQFLPLLLNEKVFASDALNAFFYLRVYSGTDITKPRFQFLLTSLRQ